jgi:hypothetical protein
MKMTMAAYGACCWKQPLRRNATCGCTAVRSWYVSYLAVTIDHPFVFTRENNPITIGYLYECNTSFLSRTVPQSYSEKTEVSYTSLPMSY